MYLAVSVGKFVKQVVTEWCPSTTGPLLPTMTASFLAPGREVLYKRYHTGELVPATILGPSTQGDDFARLKYTRNDRDYGNPAAPLSVVQFPLRSASPMSSTSSEGAPQPPSRGRTTSPPTHPSLLPSREQCKTPDGRVFYVNHTKRETQWEEPPPSYSSVRARRKARPQPSRKEVANWVVRAFAAISDDAIREACRTAYFPSGLKLSQ